MSYSIQDTDKQRLERFKEFLNFCSTNFPQPTSLVVSSILEDLEQDKYKPTSIILNASECFIAAKTIEADFPGPALLLYVSAINSFAVGEDEDLKCKIKEAKQLIKGVNEDLWKNECVQIMYNAAMNKAKIQSVNEFLKTEINAALSETSYANKEPQDLADKIVASTHKVRHEAKIDRFDNSVLVVHDGNISVLSVEEIRKGEIYLGGKIMGMYQPHLSEYRNLCRPAKIACSMCILKRVKSIGL